MSEPSKASAMKTPHNATIISAEELQVRRDVRLGQRALDGDLDAAMQWLSRFGGPEW
jgi:hypothetical protein